MTQSDAVIPSLLIVILFHPLLLTSGETTVKRYARHYTADQSSPMHCAPSKNSRDAALVPLVGVGE